MIALAVAIQASTPVSAAIYRPGIEPFVVGRDALAIDLFAACPAAGAAAGRIVVSSTWSWQRRDLVPAGLDGITIRMTPAGGPSGWQIGTIHGTPGAVQGGEGSDALGLASNGTGNLIGAAWGLDAAADGQLDGTVGFDAVPVTDNAGILAPGSVTIQVTYARDNHWHVDHEVTCSW